MLCFSTAFLAKEMRLSSKDFKKGTLRTSHASQILTPAAHKSAVALGKTVSHPGGTDKACIVWSRSCGGQVCRWSTLPCAFPLAARLVSFGPRGALCNDTTVTSSFMPR